jgi:hypothetical protein
MYGTIAPQRYPGGTERAEEEKSRNLVYLERLSKLWPVGRSWVSLPFHSTITINHKPSIQTNNKNSGERSKKQTASTKP